MNLPHPLTRCYGSSVAAVDRLHHEARGPFEPTPGVLPEAAVLVDGRHRPRFQRLHEQRAHASDEHHRVGVEVPRLAVRSEKTDVTHRVHRTCQRSSMVTLCMTSPTWVASATSIPSVT